MIHLLETTAGAILVLIFGLVFFSFMAVGVAWRFPENKEIYLLFAGIVGGFSGSLFTVIRIKGSGQTVDASGSKEVNVSSNTTTEPPTDVITK